MEYKVFMTRESDGSHTVGAFKSKKEYIAALFEKNFIDLSDKHNENNEYAPELKEKTQETSNEFYSLIASANSEKLINIPSGVEKIPIWEKYFQGKFFFAHDIVPQDKLKQIIERNEILEKFFNVLKYNIKKVIDDNNGFALPYNYNWRKEQ